MSSSVGLIFGRAGATHGERVLDHQVVGGGERTKAGHTQAEAEDPGQDPRATSAFVNQARLTNYAWAISWPTPPPAHRSCLMLRLLAPALLPQRAAPQNSRIAIRGRARCVVTEASAGCRHRSPSAPEPAQPKGRCARSLSEPQAAPQRCGRFADGSVPASQK